MSMRPDDPPPEAAQAMPLADALREYADPKLVETYRLTKEQLDRDGKWHYVGTPRDIKGYVLSEFDAHGHRLLDESRALLARIEADFLSGLQRGTLTAWAREGSPLGRWRAIPASAWASLKLGDPTAGTAEGPGVKLFDVRVGHRVETPQISPLAPTGAPGRPSNMKLVEVEFARRAQAGKLESSLNREAAWLAEWFKATYPAERPVSPKTIANKLREQFREATRG